MNRITMVGVFSVFAFAVTSCNLAGKFMDNGPDMTRSAELWSDVPRMEGLAPSEMELPATMKFIMRTVLDNLWRLNKEGEDKTPVKGDWIVFTLNSAPPNVRNFYTNERMTSFGKWEAAKESTCFDGKDKGVDGVLCVFQKVADRKEIELAIVAAQDPKTKQTNVSFLRLERETDRATSSPTSSAKIDSTPPRGPITKLDGPAPYGIEKRAMPTGTDLDQLLPKQVGPYERVLLEKSQQRGTTATSIEVDGNGVYATYRNGGREVFVEFNIASSAEYAQSSWDVVVGDANEGIYPTDPHLASFRTEPSYLKVNNENGAFFAWTRGGYFITAHAKSGEADLDSLMNAFSY